MNKKNIAMISLILTALPSVSGADGSAGPLGSSTPTQIPFPFPYHQAPVGSTIAPETFAHDLMISTGGDSSDPVNQNTLVKRALNAKNNRPIKQPHPLPANADHELAARNFLKHSGRMLGIRDESSELEKIYSDTTENGRTVIKFRQVYKKIPVYGAELTIQLDDKKDVLNVSGDLSPSTDSETSPAIEAATAKNAAVTYLATKHATGTTEFVAGEPALVFFNPALFERGASDNRLAWGMSVAAATDAPIAEYVVVDAATNEVLFSTTQIYDALYRKIHDNRNSFGPVPGYGPVMLEGYPLSGIKDVDAAYSYLGDTYNFYRTRHNRDSIDGLGLSLASTVRQCSGSCPYLNAYWDGNKLHMVYGNGFTTDDVTAHELTHGVTQYTSKLAYEKQSGAINESFSDLWGEFVDLTNAKGNDSSTVRWQIGEELPIGAIRSMKAPTAYGQPDKMTHSYYACGTSDYWGVHTNSGVNNKAVSLMVDGGSFNGFTVAPIGIDKTAKIYYEAQTHSLTPLSDYGVLYLALQNSCNRLAGTSGITAADCQQVKNAIDAVEMFMVPCAAPHVQVNGSNGDATRTVYVPANSWINTTVSFTPPAYLSGAYADVWMAAMYNGVPYYQNSAGQWVNQPTVRAQGPLSGFSASNTSVLYTQIPPNSTITFYFGVDLSMNGAFDTPYRLDTITVKSY